MEDKNQGMPDTICESPTNQPMHTQETTQLDLSDRQHTSEPEQQQSMTDAKPKNKMKRRTKIITGSIAAIVIIAVIVGLSLGYTAKKQADEKQAQADNYYSTALSFGSAVISSGSKMETIGNEVLSQWKNYVNSHNSGNSLDDCISTALARQKSNVSDVKNSDSDIYGMYSILMKVPDPDNSKMNDIKTEADKFYSDYEDMYHCTIEPNGNYTSWTTSFSSYDSALGKEYSKYMAILN